jgi:junctophilin
VDVLENLPQNTQISERSDGLKYEGEWFNNKKFGYGVTSLKDGTREEGKYKNNILVTSQRKKHLLFVRSSKLRERIDAAVQAAVRAGQIALQKADIAVSR